MDLNMLGLLCTLMLVMSVCSLVRAVHQESEVVTGGTLHTEALERLNIVPFYDASIDSLPDREQHVIKNVLLEGAIQWLSDVLRVRPLSAPIQLDRPCLNPSYYYQVDGEHYCRDQCEPVTRCGPVIVPDEHLKPCKRCTDGGRECEGGEGVMSGGVMTGHFLLYVSSIFQPSCVHSTVAMTGAHCQQANSDLDRPVAGYLNICPGTLSLRPDDTEGQLYTVLHELLHVLAFSKDLLPYFHDEQGQPRTERTRSGNIPSYNDGSFATDINTIRLVRRSRWTTVNSDLFHVISMIVTPNVLREVRSHFNCTRLIGAELENWRSEKTSRLYWEKRVFGDELMTATFSATPTISRITLALLEDSGWYVPDYSYAELLHWGRHKGCHFVNDSCGGWLKHTADEDSTPFCDELDYQLNREGCVEQRSGIGSCLLRNYPLPLPQEYQYLSNTQGGLNPILDYCPAFTKLEYKGFRIGRSCLNPDHTPLTQSFEVHSPSSRCFDLLDTELYSNDNETSSTSLSVHRDVGCYQFKCTRRRVTIIIGNQEVRCALKGQKKSFRVAADGVEYHGSVLCPDYNELCAEFDCLNGCSGHGSCELGRCKCHPGYYGDDCSWSYAIKLMNCSLVNCTNGGQCRDTDDGGFVCSCPPSFTGPLCENELVPDPCQGVECNYNGICSPIKQWTDRSCQCYPGWSGANCGQVIDMCSLAGQSCVHGVCERNTTTCVCDDSYTGETCEEEKTICHRTVEPCLNGGTCVSNSGESYSCLCREGFMGGRCELVDPCHDQLCVNSGNDISF